LILQIQFREPLILEQSTINVSVGGDFAELFQSGSETLDVCISKDVGIWEMAFIASVAVA
jgi:hypothetical protein